MKKCCFLIIALLLVPSLTHAQRKTQEDKTADEVSAVISSPSGNMPKPEQSEIITAPSGKKLEPNESEFVTEGKAAKSNVKPSTSGKTTVQAKEEVSPLAPVISVGKNTREIELPTAYSTENATPEPEQQIPTIKNLDDAKGLQ